MQYDIIIIGAGSAGMPCAIQAASRGLKVLVIEKDNQPGGTLHLTAGHLSAAGTKRQKEKGIEDSTESHLEDIVRISRNTMDAPIAKKAVALAPGTVDWLESNGYTFHDLTPLIIHGHEPYSKARTYFGKDDYAAKDITGSGKMVLKTLLPLWDKLVEEKKIEVWFNHSLERFVREGNSITSIIVKQLSTNALLTVLVGEAKLVITTGGYAANASFYSTSIKPFENNPALHFPKRLLSTANTFSQGDGIKALMEAGGAFCGAEKHMSTLAAVPVFGMPGQG
jgi:fumarate reductase flavoprotein subunit